jgi:hypothetical protein
MPTADDYTSRFEEALTKLSAAFRRFDVRHALIGGLAVGLRSRPRATLDIDFIVSTPQLKTAPVIEALVADGFSPDAETVIRDWNARQMIAMWYQGVRVDWLKPVLPVFQHVIDRSQEMLLFDSPIDVADAEGLILCKLIADRPQDRADIASLVKANTNRIDMGFIEKEWRSIGTPDAPPMTALREAFDAATRTQREH